MPDLHVFEMSMGADTVIAYDENDAWSVWEEYIGENRQDYEDEDGWDQLPDDYVLSIWSDDASFDDCGCKAKLAEHQAMVDKQLAMLDKLPPVARAELARGIRTRPRTYPNGHVHGCHVGAEKRTCAEWVAKEGRGFLCSTEW